MMPGEWFRFLTRHWDGVSLTPYAAARTARRVGFWIGPLTAANDDTRGFCGALV